MQDSKRVGSSGVRAPAAVRRHDRPALRTQSQKKSPSRSVSRHASVAHGAIGNPAAAQIFSGRGTGDRSPIRTEENGPEFRSAFSSRPAYRRISAMFQPLSRREIPASCLPPSIAPAVSRRISKKSIIWLAILRCRLAKPAKAADGGRSANRTRRTRGAER